MLVFDEGRKTEEPNGENSLGARTRTNNKLNRKGASNSESISSLYEGKQRISLKHKFVSQPRYDRHSVRDSNKLVGSDRSHRRAHHRCEDCDVYS